MTCPATTFCKRLNDEIYYLICAAVQDLDCPKECPENKSRLPFWGRSENNKEHSQGVLSATDADTMRRDLWEHEYYKQADEEDHKRATCEGLWEYY